MSLKDLLRQRMPGPVLIMSRRLRRLPREWKDKRRSAKEVFTEIYAKNLWDSGEPSFQKELPFYSGPGSGEMAAVPYADCVNTFVDTHEVKIVIDLGCGDFRVGARVARPTVQYIGVDIVEPLIQANQDRFGSRHIQFRCLDIITDEAPKGDLCLVREVLQHLSNSQISKILSKLEAFKWVIVTEYHPGPLDSFKPNRDKSHGNESRSHLNSGVVVSAPPFNVPNATLLFDVPLIQSEPEGPRFSSFLICN
jgi:SAM-dependent methyltransferase